MKYGDYLKHVQERGSIAKTLLLKAFDGCLPVGVLLVDDESQMNALAIVRVVSEKLEAGARSIHFSHTLDYKNTINCADGVVPGQEHIRLQADMFDGVRWVPDRELNESGCLAFLVQQSSDPKNDELGNAVRFAVSVAVEQKPFVDFKWKRDEHNAHIHALFNGERRFDSIYKTGSGFKVVSGTLFDRMGDARRSVEAEARTVIQSEYQELLNGLAVNSNELSVEDSLEEAKKISMTKALSYEVLSNDTGVYSGVITGVTSHHVVQSTGMEAAIHSKVNLNRVPEMNEDLKIDYLHGKLAYVAPRVVKAMGGVSR